MRLVPILVVVVSGCSLTRPDVEPCASSRDCAIRFGFGSTCTEDGLCAKPAVPPRCQAAFPSDLFSASDAHRHTTVVGALVDRSDPYGIARERAARLAFLEVNDAGGLDGHAIGIVFCTIQEDATFDSLDTTEAAIETSRYLSETLELPAILATVDSPEVDAVFGTTGTVLLMSSAARSDSLATLDATDPSDASPGRLWRTATGASEEAASMVTDVRSRGPANVFVFHERMAPSEELANAFRDAHTGVAVELRPFSVADLASVAADLGAPSAEVSEIVLITSRPIDGAEFFRQLEAIGSAHSESIAARANYFLSSALATSELAQSVPASMRARVRGTRQTPNADVAGAATDFRDAYRAEYDEEVGTEESFAAHTYDAAWLLTYGAAWSGYREFTAVTPVGIGRGLRHLSRGTSVRVQRSTWTAGQAGFERGEMLDAHGASSTLDFDPGTEELKISYSIWIVNDMGEIEVP